MRLKTVLVLAALLVGAAIFVGVGVSTAQADTGDIYFNYAGTLFKWNPSYGYQNKVTIDQFWYPDPTVSNPDRTANQGGFSDIAFDSTGGKMFGVNTSGPGTLNAGTFWLVNPNTAQVTAVTDKFADLAHGGTHDIGDSVTALTSAGQTLDGQERLFAACDGASGMSADNGHLYEWFWNGTTLSGYDRGLLKVGTPSALFGDNTNFKSVGDLWYQNDTLYGTVRAYDDSTPESPEGRFLLVSIDPATAGMTALADLDPWSDGTTGSGVNKQPTYNPDFTGTGGNNFQAMMDWQGHVGLLRQDGYVFYWDGTVGALLGENIKYTGWDVGCTSIVGGTSSPIPEPVTMLGLMLSVGGVAGYLRRRRMA